MKTIRETRVHSFLKDQHSLRVLLLEEMPASRHAYVRAFTEVGMDQVDVVTTLPEAYHRVSKKHEPYDLIVIDESFWQNKDLALSLCRAIRSDANYEHTAVVMISEECDRLNIEAAFRCGVDEFLPKYTGLRELKHLALQAILERQQATLDL